MLPICSTRSTTAIRTLPSLSKTCSLSFSSVCWKRLMHSVTSSVSIFLSLRGSLRTCTPNWKIMFRYSLSIHRSLRISNRYVSVNHRERCWKRWRVSSRLSSTKTFQKRSPVSSVMISIGMTFRLLKCRPMPMCVVWLPSCRLFIRR